MDNWERGDNMNKQLETITLGGGCFWCLEAVFDEMVGVEDVVSGYTGGHVANPTYEQVCSGATGHAEVVQVRFDPQQTSLRQILAVFFTIHDPTQLNRQGHDIGTQYRSAIYYNTPEQRRVAEEVIAELVREKIWPGKIVTELAPISMFYPAEDYHQEYYDNHQLQPYCMAVIAPKIIKFREKFAAQVKA
jgi:peptide-methionine (S)-S-oxide reductase